MSAASYYQQLALEVMVSVPGRRVWPTMLLVWEFEKRGWTRYQLQYALRGLRESGLVEHVARGAWAVAR